MFFDFARSGVFDGLYSMDRRVRVDDSEAALQSIAEHVAIQLARVSYGIRRAALDREIVMYFGVLLGLRPTEEEIAATRVKFVKERDLSSAVAMAASECNDAVGSRGISRTRGYLRPAETLDDRRPRVRSGFQGGAQ